jgi:NADH:ubiquinone oxidoreductase subunit 6 (subunit J)
MSEASLFLLVGLVSIAAAVGMLLSANAVHSALFLIVIMVCIAFMFLMLNAPFLAMVQITVYAGAIMVLFLFVIMLLGAEKLMGRSVRLRWLTPVTVVLALIFFVAAAIGIGQGQVDAIEPNAGQPLVRVAHFAPDAGLVDVYANGQLIVYDLRYGSYTEFQALPAGEYNLALYDAGSQNALSASTVTFDAGTTHTAVAHGTVGSPILTVIPEDLSTVNEDRSGRIVVFNGYDAPITLADLGSEFDDADTRLIVEDVAPGTLSEAVIVPENTALGTWAVVEPEDTTNVLTRLDGEVFTVERNTSELFVVSTDRTFDGTDRVRITSLDDAAEAGFGSPIAMGQSLFTRYLLPMQMVAVLLLVAMIGAIVLTHRPSAEPAGVERRAGRRKVSRPLTSVIANQIAQDANGHNGHDNGVALPDSVDEPVAR